MEKILVIHGPNLNMLGKRDKSHYGNKTLTEINEEITNKAKYLELEVETFQSNIEGEIVSLIQNADDNYSGIIINPAGYTHYSVVIRDAIEMLSIPVIEVHLSNIYNREDFRKKSLIAPVCNGQISGFGYLSYLLALEAIKNLIYRRV